MLICAIGVSMFFDGYMLAIQPNAWGFWIACAMVNAAGLFYLGRK